MHDGTIWFDTAACAVGDHIGNANKVTIRPKDHNSNNALTDWYSDTVNGPTARTYD